LKIKKLENGCVINTYQASWNKCKVTTYKNECMVDCEIINSNKVEKGKVANIMPHFVLVRNQPRGALPVTDCRKVLYGLMMANIPSMNSWQSIYMNLERPLMIMGLRSIVDRIGQDKFPLHDITYYGSHESMVISPTPPIVIKVSHAHAGMGKIKVNDNTGFADMRTIVAINDDYCTAETYIEPEYGIRVQKIGNHYRVMKKMFTGSGWKSHFGGAALFIIELTDAYKCWADECSKLFGGMDLLAVDAIHGTDGKDYIIECNDTAIGIMVEHWIEDSTYIIEMLIDKCNKLYC